MWYRSYRHENLILGPKKPPPSTKRGWLRKTGAGRPPAGPGAPPLQPPPSCFTVLPLRLFFFATSENVNSFFLPPPGRRCFLCLELVWSVVTRRYLEATVLHLTHVISLHLTSAIWSRSERSDRSGQKNRQQSEQDGCSPHRFSSSLSVCSAAVIVTRCQFLKWVNWPKNSRKVF